MTEPLKRIYVDLETTGVDVTKHGVHQIAMLIETPDTRGDFNFNVRPVEGKMVSPEALEVGGVTIEQLREYPSAKTVYLEMVATLGQCVDKFDKRDKFQVFAYNAPFDTQFLRQWFADNGDVYYGSWFWHPPIDIMTLAAHHLMDRRPSMINFKLGTVAQELGIETDEEQLHDGLYDIRLAKKVYEALTAKQTQGATA